MQRTRILASLLPFCFPIALAAHALSQQSATVSSNTPAKNATHDVHPQKSAGELAFERNCSRCHQAPDQLSPRITGTVLMHMRTRANLSAADEKLIREFLAP